MHENLIDHNANVLYWVHANVEIGYSTPKWCGGETACVEHSLLVEYRRIILPLSRNDTGSGGSPEDALERIKDLLKQNRNDAVQAEVSAIGSTHWNEHNTRLYRERAEILESTFVKTGDEHAAFVLLEDDWRTAKKSFMDESRSASQLPGVHSVHCDAMKRYSEYRSTLQRT